MKSMVFANFLEMVEERHSLDTVDALLTRAALGHDGVYAATGTHPHEELVAPVVALGEETETSVPEVLREYGRYLFERLARAFPQFVEARGSSLDFLARLDNHIHVEVRKLYPDAELPRFSYFRHDADSVEMLYHSSRHLEDLARGLLEGCFAHFGETTDLRVTNHEQGGVRFTLVHRQG